MPGCLKIQRYNVLMGDLNKLFGAIIIGGNAITVATRQKIGVSIGIPPKLPHLLIVKPTFVCKTKPISQSFYSTFPLYFSSDGGLCIR